MVSDEASKLRIRRGTDAQGRSTYSVESQKSAEPDRGRRSKDTNLAAPLQPVEKDKEPVRESGRKTSTKADRTVSRQRSQKTAETRSVPRTRKTQSPREEQKRAGVRDRSRRNSHRRSPVSVRRHSTTHRRSRRRSRERSRHNHSRRRSDRPVSAAGVTLAAFRNED